MTIDLPGFINVMMFASIVGAAVIYLTSQSRKAAHKETVELADTRGEKIDDLEARIVEMQEHIMRLDGQVELVLSKKFDELTDDIAEKVVEKVAEIINPS
jgi:peptidoglycan hydrolase CwlO-like protein